MTAFFLPVSCQAVYAKYWPLHFSLTAPTPSETRQDYRHVVPTRLSRVHACLWSPEDLKYHVVLVFTSFSKTNGRNVEMCHLNYWKPTQILNLKGFWVRLSPPQNMPKIAAELISTVLTQGGGNQRDRCESWCQLTNHLGKTNSYNCSAALLRYTGKSQPARLVAKRNNEHSQDQMVSTTIFCLHNHNMQTCLHKKHTQPNRSMALEDRCIYYDPKHENAE